MWFGYIPLSYPILPVRLPALPRSISSSPMLHESLLPCVSRLREDLPYLPHPTLRLTALLPHLPLASAAILCTLYGRLGWQKTPTATRVWFSYLITPYCECVSVRALRSIGLGIYVQGNVNNTP